MILADVITWSLSLGGGCVVSFVEGEGVRGEWSVVRVGVEVVVVVGGDGDVEVALSDGVGVGGWAGGVLLGTSGGGGGRGGSMGSC